MRAVPLSCPTAPLIVKKRRFVQLPTKSVLEFTGKKRKQKTSCYLTNYLQKQIQSHGTITGPRLDKFQRITEAHRHQMKNLAMRGFLMHRQLSSLIWLN
jgi:hypothetical protein